MYKLPFTTLQQPTDFSTENENNFAPQQCDIWQDFKWESYFSHTGRKTMTNSMIHKCVVSLALEKYKWMQQLDKTTQSLEYV